MQTQYTKDQIASIECRFAVHCPTPNGSSKDLHVVKEIIHTKDGHKIPNVRLIEDFKRSYYITKKGSQNHKDKKEWELLSNLNEYKSTQTDLARNVAKAVGEFKYMNELRKTCRNPYIYGADIQSTALIKQRYQKQFPGLQTPFSVACFDVETDVLYGTEQIIMATISYGDRVFTAIQSSFLKGFGSNVIEQLQKKLDHYIGEYVKKRNIKWDVQIVDSEAAIVIECFNKAHEWKPDFVAIWNITFDMNKLLQALEKAHIDPKDVFSDPAVPHQYRFFKFKQGPKQKVTASGKVTPIKPAAQWHTVFCPSSFYFIDAMCAYKHIRISEAERQSYALDSVLEDRLGIRKLKFEEANKYRGLEWHQFMQEKFPLEYVIYNVFDCVSMEELDEVTSDLNLTLPMMSKTSDFENFKSQPRRLVDDLHFFCLENERVIGTTSDELSGDDDEETLDLKGWIITLPAHLVADNGLQVIEENPNLRTNIRGHVGDLDVAASYPNGECVFNISKETTKREICEVEGIPEYTFRSQGINLSGGRSNASEYCQTMFGLPTMDKMLAHYKTSKSVIEQVI